MKSNKAIISKWFIAVILGLLSIIIGVIGIILTLSQIAPVGVRNLIKVRQKYLFRSFLPKQKDANRRPFCFVRELSLRRSALPVRELSLRTQCFARRANLGFAYPARRLVGERLGAPVF